MSCDGSTSPNCGAFRLQQNANAQQPRELQRHGSAQRAAPICVAFLHLLPALIASLACIGMPATTRRVAFVHVVPACTSHARRTRARMREGFAAAAALRLAVGRRQARFAPAAPMLECSHACVLAWLHGCGVARRDQRGHECADCPGTRRLVEPSRASRISAR